MPAAEAAAKETAKAASEERLLPDKAAKKEYACSCEEGRAGKEKPPLPKRTVLKKDSSEKACQVKRPAPAKKTDACKEDRTCQKTAASQESSEAQRRSSKKPAPATKAIKKASTRQEGSNQEAAALQEG